MRKTLLSFIALFFTVAIMAQQPVEIIGFTFPVNAGADSLDANKGIEQNLGYDIRHENEGNEIANIAFSKGAGGDDDFAAKADGWNGGADKQYWSVKFKASGYQNFKLSAKLSSANNKPGPANWKVQYCMSGDEIWNDVEGGAITCAKDWTTGVVENLALPADLNNPQKSVYVRWIMTSNVAVGGDDVAADGICRIDDIMITGEAIPVEGDVVAGWTFPLESGDDMLNANLGLEGNSSRFIGRETDDVTIYMKNGQASGDFAATSENWDNGADTKYYEVKFKANMYRDFKVSSKIRAGGQKGGPQDWKIQYKQSGGEYADVVDGAFTAGNDWEMGMVENLPLPEDCNYPQSKVSIRWIMTSNVSVGGGEVAVDGIAKIDDIIITALSPIGIETPVEVLYTRVYPNPSHGEFVVESNEKLSSVEVYNLNGQRVFSALEPGESTAVSLGDMPAGLYMVRIMDDQMQVTVKKVMLQ